MLEQMKDPYEIIKSPLVTEKTMQGTALHKYSFSVAPDSNKIEIKEAIEKVFNVHVTKVNTLNVKGKTRRRGRAPQGRTSDWKKAIVTLAEGEHIDIFERA